MTAAEEDFIERMGRHFERDGIPRIGGRLFGLLLLQEEPRSLDELSDALSVSKASVSTNARLLDQWGLVERVTRPGDRRDYYAPAVDLTRTLELRLQRVRDMSDLLRSGLDAVPADHSAAADRLARMARFNDEAEQRIAALLDRWKRDRADTDS